MRMLIFAALLFGCFFYALARGGWPERTGILILMIGSVLSAVANSPLQERYASVEIGIFLVDAGMLAAYLALALATDRYWPLWITALQLLVVLAHLAKLADPDMLRNGYGFIMAVWSYPQIIIMALATRAHHRRKTAAPAAPSLQNY